MKVSYNWLQNYFEEKLPEPEKISEGIIFHSFEVEEVLKVGGDTVLTLKFFPTELMIVSPTLELLKKSLLFLI